MSHMEFKTAAKAQLTPSCSKALPKFKRAPEAEGSLVIKCLLNFGGFNEKKKLMKGGFK